MKETIKIQLLDCILVLGEYKKTLYLSESRRIIHNIK